MTENRFFPFLNFFFVIWFSTVICFYVLLRSERRYKKTAPPPGIAQVHLCIKTTSLRLVHHSKPILCANWCSLPIFTFLLINSLNFYTLTKSTWRPLLHFCLCFWFLSLRCVMSLKELFWHFFIFFLLNSLIFYSTISGRWCKKNCSFG